MSASSFAIATRFLHAARNAAAALPTSALELVQSCPFCHWIEIVLVGDDERPVAGEEYRVTAPDGREYRGRLDQRGFARLDGLTAGTCRVEFPSIDVGSLARV